jgi:hypothetical protein
MREPGRTLRRVAWRRAASKPAAEIADLGPARLDSFARAFADRAPSVLHSGLRIAFADAAHCTEPALLPSDRMWRCELQSVPVWCAIDALSHRALLEWILHGPGAAIPTVVERTIVSECVDRTLSPSVEIHWRESVGGFDLPQDVWLCVLDISGEGTSATIKLYTAAVEAPRARFPVLDEVPIDIEAQLRPFAVRFGAVLCWEPGATVRLGDSPDAIHAQLQFACGPLVFGTLGCADGRRAIRLSGSAACRWAR